MTQHTETHPRATIAPRTLLSRLLSPAGFGCVLLLFLLPFVAISCDTQRGPITASFTGLDMVIGGQPDLSGASIGPAEQQDLLTVIHQSVDVEPMAVLATIVIFIGMVGALIRERLARHATGSGLAALALALLIWAELRSIDKLQNLRSSSVRGLLDTPPTGATSPRYGFWLAVLVLALLLVAHGAALMRAWRHPSPARLPAPASEPVSERGPGP